MTKMEGTPQEGGDKGKKVEISEKNPVRLTINGVQESFSSLAEVRAFLESQIGEQP